jgi:hypothetical protein
MIFTPLSRAMFDGIVNRKRNVICTLQHAALYECRPTMMSATSFSKNLNKKSAAYLHISGEVAVKLYFGEL